MTILSDNDEIVQKLTNHYNKMRMPDSQLEKANKNSTMFRTNASVDHRSHSVERRATASPSPQNRQHHSNRVSPDFNPQKKKMKDPQSKKKDAKNKEH